MLVQIAVMSDLVPTLQDRLHGCRIALHTPGGQEKGLVHTKALIQLHQAGYRNLWPIAQHRHRREPRVCRSMVRQMQNAVGVHVEGKGHRTPGAVGPWHWIGDHGLSSSAGKRMGVSTGAYAGMPQDTEKSFDGQSEGKRRVYVFG